jgi:hypothetical protein
VDSATGAETGALARRGETPPELPSTILALDARTGEERWQRVVTNPFRTYTIGHWLGMRGNDDWLAYCAEAGVVLAGKGNRVRALDASTGDDVWEATIGGGQPFMVDGSAFLTQALHTYDVRTGELIQEGPAFSRGGCNYAIANRHLILLRERSVAYVERNTHEWHYLRSIRSGCSNSLIPADGLLNAPCFSVACVCNYPIQTSFAMVHMPEAAQWDTGE